MIDKSTLRTILLGMMSCLYMHALFAAEPVTGPHFRIEMRSGNSSIAQQRFIVKKDDIVLIRCSSDARGQLHVHGYRLSLDLKSGETQDLQFKAYATGRYRIEWQGELQESSNKNHHGPALATLEVRPQ